MREALQLTAQGVIAGAAAGMNGTVIHVSELLIFSVIWVPDEALLRLYPGQDFGAKQILSDLQAFRPEEWGL